MPTDVLCAVQRRIAAEKRKAADLLAMLLLGPLIACLGTIILTVTSPAFAAVVTAMGVD